MKSRYIFTLALAGLFACGGGGDKQARLNELKKKGHEDFKKE